MGLGMRELVVILLVVLVIFGTKKLRAVGSDLGHAVRGFKKAVNEGEEEQSNPPKQIRAEGSDADFADAKQPEKKPERSA
jgi:sec-independent protein translocase protein TatA